MEQYLSNEEILELIQHYLVTNIYNYAVLIDGDWGCGKTHFIKYDLIPNIEKSERGKKPIYISLYGIQDMYLYLMIWNTAIVISMKYWGISIVLWSMMESR